MRYIFSSAQSTIAALELDLTNCPGFDKRPLTNVEFKAVLPGWLSEAVWKAPPKATSKATSSRSTGAKVASSKAKADDGDKGKAGKLGDFLNDLQVSVEDVTSQVRLLKTAIHNVGAPVEKIGKNPLTILRRPSREHPLLSARVCAVTTAPFPRTATRASRDTHFYLCAGIAEYYFVEKVRYRQSLLPGALGAVRNQIKAILDPCVTPYDVEVENGETRTVSSWVYIDHLDAPESASARPVEHAEVMAIARRDGARAETTAFLARIRAKVEGHEMAKAAKETPESTEDFLDEGVAESLEALIAAFWTNSERRLYRESVGHPFAKYYLGDEREIPDELVIKSDNALDENTFTGVSASAILMSIRD